MVRVACYVDGFNLYHAIDDIGRDDLKWLNLRALAQLYVKPVDQLVSVTYFTAKLNWNRTKRMRHLQYMAALRTYGVEIVESYFQKNRRHCRAGNKYCVIDQEKKTDVALAIRVYSDALTQRLDRQLVVTADNDQVPVFEMIRTEMPAHQIEMVAPPDRLKLARDLGNSATYHHELTAGQLASCQLPRNVYDSRGRFIASRPAQYDP
jgi:hypothetical protein